MTVGGLTKAAAEQRISSLLIERGVLRQHYATDALDASTLLAGIFGFLGWLVSKPLGAFLRQRKQAGQRMTRQGRKQRLDAVLE